MNSAQGGFFDFSKTCFLLRGASTKKLIHSPLFHACSEVYQLSLEYMKFDISLDYLIKRFSFHILRVLDSSATKSYFLCKKN